MKNPEFSSESYTPDRLVVNTDGLRTGEETVLGGQGTLARGTVVARDSVNANKLVPVDSASATASINDAVAILAQDVDTSGGDAAAPLYYAGEFNEAELAFGGTDTIADHRDAMRQRGLFTRSAVSA
ncbi:head decoration protein [Spiribacter halobius]|uniref:Head decoration protein n=1 Tax=Sediminicurvatus halobius TaxID=2182432 RepID=A0A2U2MY72_9GAMM|nr:head decoration protein [Spiribacter halobius]PWG61767.1 head decoration protein [Spiribacter halobius]UEX76799.1 head decoration protein [Spiribacter halobius]